jgi:2-polyprenyl-3-methyl-5-hydroxy-6-metoxy-1,4-benzoquinol methylase
MSASSTYFNAERGVIAKFLPENYENVLEVGCAAGGFSRHLPKAKQIWGIEPNLNAASEAKLRLMRVLEGTYGEVENELPDNYFDLLICNDVIEHMSDHDAFFTQVRKKMKPGAILVGSLPNIRHVTALVKLIFLKDWRYSSSGILDRTHLRFFTEKSIQRMFVEHSLQVEKMSGVGSVISNGFLRDGNPLSFAQQFALRSAMVAITALSFGTLSDLQYPQYAFRVKFT